MEKSILNKKTYKIQLFIIYPCLFIFVCYLVYHAYGFFTGKLASYLFPTQLTQFEMSKIYITSSFFMILFEYFILSDLPNNYFLSRMLGVILMVSLYLFFSSFYSLNFYIHLLIIFFSTFFTYFIQKANHFSNQALCGWLIVFFLNGYLLYMV